MNTGGYSDLKSGPVPSGWCFITTQTTIYTITTHRKSQPTADNNLKISGHDAIEGLGTQHKHQESNMDIKPPNKCRTGTSNEGKKGRKRGKKGRKTAAERAVEDTAAAVSGIPSQLTLAEKTLMASGILVAPPEHAHSLAVIPIPTTTIISAHQR
ncbi:hypothetical protein BYT27DRAFT_7262796 [Phlegmacium glaucopus]|nr:hypothetical protein BYT27DRAFT_7262796 [Phlegmacium glaucopus]